MRGLKPYTILYEDNRILAVNKASGIAVTGERWDPDAPRLDLLLKEEAGELFTVHRIDKETSGLVIFAKNRESHRALSSAFESRRVEKTYTAVIHGRPSWPGGETSCDLPLLPDGNKKHLTVIDKYRGKKSFTRFSLTASAGNYSIVRAVPETGRTHQIRVHAAALGHPIVCDPLYGRHARSGKAEGVYLSSFKPNWRGDEVEERPLLARLGLHAEKLVLDRSLLGAEKGAGNDTADTLVLEAPLFRDMAALFKQMGKVNGVAQTTASTDFLINPGKAP